MKLRQGLSDNLENKSFLQQVVLRKQVHTCGKHKLSLFLTLNKNHLKMHQSHSPEIQISGTARGNGVNLLI